VRGSGGGSKGDRGGGMSGVSMGGGGGGGSDGKPTRVRTVLNEKQLHTLRTCYAANPRPDALMKEQLVEMTGLSPRVIRVWFQNKRCKDKKKAILMKQIQQQEKVDPSHINRPINTYYHLMHQVGNGCKATLFVPHFFCLVYFWFASLLIPLFPFTKTHFKNCSIPQTCTLQR